MAQHRARATDGAEVGLTGRDRGVEHGHHPEAGLLSTPGESAESTPVEAPPLHPEMHETVDAPVGSAEAWITILRFQYVGLSNCAERDPGIIASVNSPTYDA